MRPWLDQSVTAQRENFVVTSNHIKSFSCLPILILSFSLSANNAVAAAVIGVVGDAVEDVVVCDDNGDFVALKFYLQQR